MGPKRGLYHPPIVSVGISDEARKRNQIPQKPKGIRLVYSTPISGARLWVQGIDDEESDLVLGAHLVGPHVEEVINVFAFAIRHGLTVTDLKSTIFAYPTGASDIGDML